MKKTLFFSLFCCIVFSCQKSIHWDIASVGSLVKDNNGNCLPVSVSGNYIADSSTNADNYITVDVDVTTTGTYNIFTDSINGYVFKATGEFNNRGINHVKLLCNGKPIKPDTNYFTIHYDTSVCAAKVIVKSNALPAAVFSLQGAPGECLNDTVMGTFIKGIALDTSNRVNISVNVTVPGRYSINTDVVNGYSFTATGVFATAGLQTVIIYPMGTPVNEGTDIFNIQSNSSACSLSIKVNSDEASFTLEGSPGKCMNDTVLGVFVKDVPLDSISKVNISVNVITAGRYTIITNAANGYSFSASGVFNSTGIQTVPLYANGTPLNAGTDIFTLKAGGSTCNFEINVLSDFVQVTSDDYFPMTDSSYWIYDDLFNKGNIVKATINGNSTVSDTVYEVRQEVDGYGASSESLFRRNDNDYFEYAREDKYTGSFQYAKSLYTNLRFLNQQVQQGDYWETPEFQDIASYGQELLLKYGYKCIKTGAIEAVNGNVFANVCIIEMRPQIRTTEHSWGYTNEVYTYYYAKGVGIIYYKAINNYNFTKAEMQLKSWLVK